jgi:hypothetical protein
MLIAALVRQRRRRQQRQNKKVYLGDPLKLLSICNEQAIIVGGVVHGLAGSEQGA